MLKSLQKTTSNSAVHKPISTEGKHHKNEIFVDIVERLSVTFNSSGHPTRSEIDGAIQMKSYLSGNPELRLALNEDLIIGKTSANRYGALVLDDCNFHECARLNEFEQSRVLSFNPPDGEFALMNYRVTASFKPPFKLSSIVDVIGGGYKVEWTLRVNADIPEQNYGGNMDIEIQLPKGTTGCAFEWVTTPTPAGHEFQFDVKDKVAHWKTKKFPGGKELIVKLKLSMANSVSASIKKELGPVGMSFNIPMYNVSGLQVRYLRILETGKGYNPYRWVRYLTQSTSYVFRI
jgi:AP-4 complex subunit mu-1